MINVSLVELVMKEYGEYTKLGWEADDLQKKAADGRAKAIAKWSNLGVPKVEIAKLIGTTPTRVGQLVKRGQELLDLEE